MADTFSNDLRLRLQESGSNAGTWGDLLNDTITNIASGFGQGSEAIPNASTHTITLADGAADEARSLYLKFTGGGQACTVTLGPNTISKVWIIDNATSYTLTFSQGSGANVAIAAGAVKVIATDGAGSGAAVVDTLDGLEGSLSSLTVTGEITANGGIALGDNDKATFGASDDLQIYHDGTDSFLIDNGTGRLNIRSSSDFLIANTANNQNYLYAVESGAVTLFHSGSTKLATTSTGIDVTGTITSTAFGSQLATTLFQQNVLKSSVASSAGAFIRMAVSGASNPTYAFEDDQNTGMFTSGADTLNFTTGGTQRLTIAATGDLIGTSNSTGLAASFENSHADGFGVRITTYSNATQYGLAVDSYGGGYSRDFTVGVDGNVNVLTGNLVIGTAGKGIDFSVNSGATGVQAELLNDYETGTWTMGLTTTNSDSNITTVNTTGYYTKIGNLVTVNIYNAGSNVISAGTGTAKITGLPFTVLSGNGYYSAAAFAHTNLFSTTYSAYPAIGSTEITVTQVGSIAGASFATGNPKYMMMSLTYMTGAA